VVIPAQVRQELGLEEGDEVLVTREQNGIRISTLEQAVHEIQAFFTRLKAPGESVVDELIEDRRQDAIREDGGFR
jgi:AbrB family looped-hinge helix DNA binding protein